MHLLSKFGTLLLTATVSISVHAKDITISSSADYSNPELIQTNIKESCTALGDNFVKFTKAYLQKSGWNVSLSESVGAEAQDTAIKLEITDSVSAGNWFIGHRKSTTIRATLYENGEVADSYVASRFSSGGFWGGFKGSCSILNRTVKTLGSDVTKWVNKKVS